MVEIYLLLGTNLGQRLDNLRQAKSLLHVEGIKVNAESGIYETEAWGKTDQATFLNQVIQVETELSAKKLLSVVHSIEKEMGRVRQEKWGERLIDIDILYYGHHVIIEEGLVIPHPEIQNRRFTLIPLVDIAQGLIHPLLNKSQKDLLRDCPDLLEVEPYELTEGYS